MPNENAKNCWEYWGCSESDKATCPAFMMDMGKECWIVTNSMNGFMDRIKSDSKNCWECPWFKKMSHRFANND